MLNSLNSLSRILLGGLLALVPSAPAAEAGKAWLVISITEKGATAGVAQCATAAI